jgi:hypothetical protein
MEKLNPKPPAEALAAKEEEEFLAGGEQAPREREGARPAGGHHH